MLREEAGVAICEAYRPKEAQQADSRRRRGRGAAEADSELAQHTREWLLMQRRNPKWKHEDPPHQAWLPDKVLQRAQVQSRFTVGLGGVFGWSWCHDNAASFAGVWCMCCSNVVRKSCTHAYLFVPDGLGWGQREVAASWFSRHPFQACPARGTEQ